MGAHNPTICLQPRDGENITNVLFFNYYLLCKNGNFYKKFIKQVQGTFAEIHLPAQKVRNVIL